MLASVCVLGEAWKGGACEQAKGQGKGKGKASQHRPGAPAQIGRCALVPTVLADAAKGRVKAGSALKGVAWLHARIARTYHPLAKGRVSCSPPELRPLGGA